MSLWCKAFLVALALAGCITSSSAAPLTEWDAEQLRALQATGIYDNQDETRETGNFLVYLAFHVVRNSGGLGGISQFQLDQAMLDLAEAFDGTGICFTVAHQDTINDSGFNFIDNATERAVLKSINNQPDMIDCYFVFYDGGNCGVSSYTWSPDQGITFANSCVGVASNPSAFPHEFGHYFNLLDTHETAYGAECPSGNNCATTGDLVCDTPADPGLSTSNVNGDCVYTGTQLTFCDFLNRPYMPSTTNYMSSSRFLCRSEFTPGQRNRMHSTLINLRWGEAGFNSPDFDFFTPAGWSNSLVPRNAPGANSTSCTVTATLSGGAQQTWLNQVLRQANTGSHHPGVYGRLFLDNQFLWSYSYDGGTWYGLQYVNNFGPLTVRGGRHAIHSQVDVFDDVCESSENNNIRNTQWVWSPLELSTGQSLQRSAPPDRMASIFTYPNCDGYQFTGTTGWSVVAMQPLSTAADYDMNLHTDYTGSTAGFQSFLATSYQPTGEPDWVIVNHNIAPAATFQVGINNFNGATADMRVDAVESRALWKGDGTRIVGTVGENRILDIFEVYFSPGEITQDWTVTLGSPDAADLDLYLYPATGTYMARHWYLESSTGSGTSSETLTLAANTDLPVAGWYAVVVSKSGLSDLAIEADYEVRFTNNSPKLGIDPPAPIQVAVIQDQAPWGGTGWTDQLTAQGIAYTVIPTASLAAAALDTYGAVIIPSPVSITSHDNIMASITILDNYNRRGGVLVQGTATSSMTTGFTAAGGVQATWENCELAHTGGHWMVGGAGAVAEGSFAVNHVLTPPGPGWTMLAYSDCGANGACMLLNESAGMLVYGAPIEHSIQFFDQSLGESIENIVRWAAKRARQTLRMTTLPGSPAVTANLLYSKSLLSSVTYTHAETSPWLSVGPVSATIPMLDPDDTISYTFAPAGQPNGVHRAEVSVNHSLTNTPETVFAYLNISSRTPAAPLDLRITPVDFSPGNATVNVNWTPVTTDSDGLPLAVDHYRLYFSRDPYMGTAEAFDLLTTNLNLFFGNLGWHDMGFVRVTAVDTNGLLVADSHPDQPLPRTVAGDPRLLQPAVPGGPTR